MKEYKLIAFDMDGTLLNSEKKIAPGSVAMIKRAVQEGKEVVLSTGRGVAELKEYMEILPEVRYLNCTSGAMVYDRRKKQAIARNAISEENMRKILNITREEDVMLHFLSTRSVVQQSSFEKMEQYQMGLYKPMFAKVADKCQDIYQYFYNDPKAVEKCNIYHRSPEDRTLTEKRILEQGIPVTMAYSEIASLEVTAEGANKGSGLTQLCRHLGISVNETIAVGDADNDIEILKTAGLSVAMGNAAGYIKELADVVVADCDHGGCAEAIEKYLLA